MKILLVSATEAEVAAYLSRKHEWVHSLITGVGSVATTYALSKALASDQYDFVLQAGVGGSYDKGVPLGSVLHVVQDCFGDLGAEDHDKYVSMMELGLIQANEPPYSNGMLCAPPNNISNAIALPKVSGITVQTVTGSASTVALRGAMGHVVESMEGAAMHYVCLQEGIAFAQVRGISNYVTPRDRNSWKMKDAIVNLNEWLSNFLAKV